MSFIENMSEIFGEELFSAHGGFRAVLYGMNAAYFESVTGVSVYTPEEISFFVKGAVITVTGEELYIKKYCAGDLAICGKIISLTKR